MSNEQTTAVVNWDEELAKYAKEDSAPEQGNAGGKFFSVKGATLSWSGVPIKNNQIGVIIAAAIIEHSFYEDKYVPGEYAAPVCFAFGRVESEMAPHPLSSKPQSPRCEDCPQNQYPSKEEKAKTGRGGKPCANVRRLALLPAGEFDKAGVFQPEEDVVHFAEVGPGYLKVPVTSVKDYSTFVVHNDDVLHRPTWSVYTRVRVLPDPDNTLKVVFDVLGACPTSILPALKARHDELQATIAFPYTAASKTAAPVSDAANAAPASASAKAEKY